MATILNIETSTNVCSALLADGDRILMERVCHEPQNHARLLPVFLQEIITFARENGAMPQAVAVSAGPGSYTGLRIGVSSAKGVCYALNIPLIAIDTLEIIAVQAIKEVDWEAIYCPMIDARRMEVYTALFDTKLNLISPTEAKIIDQGAFEDILRERKIVFCGDGADKCKGTIQDKNAVFVDNIAPLSRNMMKLAEDKFDRGDFVDTAYFEPFYLKEFFGTKPKKLF